MRDNDGKVWIQRSWIRRYLNSLDPPPPHRIHAPLVESSVVSLDPHFTSLYGGLGVDPRLVPTTDGTGHMHNHPLCPSATQVTYSTATAPHSSRSTSTLADKEREGGAGDGESVSAWGWGRRQFLCEGERERRGRCGLCVRGVRGTKRCGEWVRRKRESSQQRWWGGLGLLVGQHVSRRGGRGKEARPIFRTVPL